MTKEDLSLISNEVKHTHQTINGKYRICIERAASTKGIDGFKVEANGDVLPEVKMDVDALYAYAMRVTRPLAPVVEVKEK